MTETLTMPGLAGLAPAAPVDPRAAAEKALEVAQNALADAKKKVEGAHESKKAAQAIIDAAKPTIMLAEAQVKIAQANLLALGGKPKAEGGDKVTFEQVIAVLRGAASQMTVEDIRVKLLEGGINASADNLKAYLARWAAAGAVVKGEKTNRLEPARYYAPAAPVNAPAMPGAAPAGTPLPEDFPGREALVTAGYTTVESVPNDFDALFALDGIGKATAKSIVEALG